MFNTRSSQGARLQPKTGIPFNLHQIRHDTSKTTEDAYNM